MNKLFRYINDYLNLNRREQRGIVILLLILLLVASANFIIPFVITNKSFDSNDFEAKVKAFYKQQKYLSDSIENSKTIQTEYSKTLNPFEFDPNNLSVNNWKKLGLTDQQVSVIKNYEAKGGQFKQPEDLAKMYSISEEEYKILKPFISIVRKDKDTKTSINSTFLNPTFFNPNTATAEDFEEMNFPQNLANAILKYRSKGGTFKIKKDLLKIYVLSEDDYTKLEPYINLPEIVEPKAEIEILLSIELNTADTLDLQQIRGIGPSFARRIIKYRSMLGGYHSAEQLMEVYGMDSLKYNNIVKHITIDNSKINKININSSTIKVFVKHPYFEFYLAKSIITYKEDNGEFTDIEDVKNVKLIYDELFEKIKPYITILEP